MKTYPIIVSLDSNTQKLIKNLDLNLVDILKISILKCEKPEFTYFFTDFESNIKCHLDESYFYRLYEMSLQNNYMLNILASELILEEFIKILSYEYS